MLDLSIASQSQAAYTYLLLEAVTSQARLTMKGAWFEGVHQGNF